MNSTWTFVMFGAALAAVAVVACGDVEAGAPGDAALDRRLITDRTVVTKPRDAGAEEGARDSTVPILGYPDATNDSESGLLDGTTFTLVDAGPLPACNCVYRGIPPHGACSMDGLKCAPPPPFACNANPNSNSQCGAPTCTCADAAWRCTEVSPCK